MIVYGAYVSHGSPEILMHDDDPWIEAFRKVGRGIMESRPETVVTISPHFFVPSNYFLIPSSERLACMHDYYGFPAELYEIRCAFANDLEFVNSVLSAARDYGLNVMLTDKWGLDHGSWLPLRYMELDAVKFATISINSLPAQEHIKLGRLIREASQQKRVAVIATGSPTHRTDLMYFGLQKEAYEFDKKLIELIEGGQIEKVPSLEGTEEYRYSSPEGMMKPFYVLLGALGNRSGKVLAYDVPVAGLSMIAAEFK